MSHNMIHHDSEEYSDDSLQGVLSPRRSGSPLLQHPDRWDCHADASPKKTEDEGDERGFGRQFDSIIVASVVSHHKAKNGSHTVYDILVNVRDGAETISAWRVCRRYNAFHKLHGDLKHLSFPCPELPPKALLWATFLTASFLDQRKAALNIWLQGCLCIWQSIRIEDAKTAYEIAELIESFLCEEDTLVEARARGFSSPFQFMRLQQYSSYSPDAMPLNANHRSRSVPELPRSMDTTQSGEKLLKGHNSTRKDNSPYNSAKFEPFSPSADDVGVAAISYRDDRMVYGGNVGHGSNGNNTSTGTQDFVTYSGNGGSVRQTFRPFTATVSFGGGREGTFQVKGTPSCTPVSVPPTPDGQHEFLNSWSRYTETVLEYVADRLVEAPNERAKRTTSLTLSSGSNSAATISAFGACDDVDTFEASSAVSQTRMGDQVYEFLDDEEDDEEESSPSSRDGTYVPFQTREGFVFSSSTLRQGSNSANSTGASNSGSTSTRSTVQTAGDSTGPNRKRDQVDSYGIKMIRKVLAETENAIDFIGSSYDFVAKVKDVIVLRKQEERKKNSLHCFMGRGALDCSASEVFNLVRNPSSKHCYDRLVKDGSEQVIQVLEGAFNPVVFHQLFETKQRLYFLRHSRDFCVLQYSVKLSDGRFIVAGSSVRHNSCPPVQGIVRGKIDLFGWVIEPLSEKKCKATYVVKVDFGGNVPTKFLDTVSFRQPLCVRYVEEYLLSQREDARVEAAARGRGSVDSDPSSPPSRVRGIAPGHANLEELYDARSHSSSSDTFSLSDEQ